MAKIGTVELDIKADTAKLVSGMDRAEKSVKRTVGNIQKTIIGLAAAYAGFEGVRKLRSMVDDAVDLADATGKTAQQLGYSANEFSKYKYAIGYAAIEQSAFNQGSRALVKNIDAFIRTGGGAGADAFKRLGIDADFASKHMTTTDSAMREILKRLEQLPTGLKKTAIAQGIFGDEASAMLRLTLSDLETFGAEAERIGIAIPDNIAKMAASYHDQMDQIHARLTGIGRTVSFSLLPVLDAASKAGVLTFDNILQSQKKVQDGMPPLTNAFADMVETMAYGAGFVTDSWSGVRLVMTSIEHMFYTVAISINKAFDHLVTDKVNETLDIYNAIAGLVGAQTIDARIVNQKTIDLQQRMIELRAEADRLTLSLHDGRDAADEFATNFRKNLEESSKAANKTTAAVQKTSAAVRELGASGKDLKLDDATKNIVTQFDKAKNIIDGMPKSLGEVNSEYQAMYDVVKDLFDENEMQKFYSAWQKEAEGSMEEFAQSGGWQDVWTENAAQTFTNAMQQALNGEFDVSSFANNIANSIAQSLSKLGPEGAVAGALVQLYEPLIKAASKHLGGKSYEGAMIGTALAGLTGGITGLGIGALFGGSGGSGIGLIGTNAGRMTVKSSGGYSGDWGDVITADTLMRVMTASYSESSVAGVTTGGKVSADWYNESALQQVRGFFIAFDAFGSELAGFDPLEMEAKFYKSVKKFNDALGKGMLESITGANADALYKEWQAYAKEAGVETIDAILGSLQTALTAQRSVDVYNAGSTSTEALALLSQYAQADLDRYAKSIGAEDVTLANYNAMYDQLIATSPTPDMIDAWAQLGQMLIAADQAAQNYQDSLASVNTVLSDVAEADVGVQETLVQFSDSMLSLVNDMTMRNVPLNNITYMPTLSYRPAISVNAMTDSETKAMLFSMQKGIQSMSDKFRNAFEGTNQGVVLRTKAVTV